jgi:PAS domain S-box-containing protein
VSPAIAVALFVLLYAPMVVVGYSLKENVGALTIVWPGAGILLVSLYLSPLRVWPELLLSAALVEIFVGYWVTHNSARGYSPVFVAANLTDGVVGALLVRYAARDPGTPRLCQVLGFFAASAIGAAVGAIVGAWSALRELTAAPYWHLWQLWWAGNWLGSLTLAPVGLTWAVRFLAPERAAHPVHPMKLAAIGCLVLSCTGWVFYSGNNLSLVHVPYTVLIMLLVATYWLPPRWVTSLCAATVLMAAAFAARGFGPFVTAASPFARVLSLQLFLAVAAVSTFMLTTVLLEKRRLMVTLKQSEERYRGFLRHSSEAVWRIELREPMPIALPVAEQMSWLRQHAYIGECSQTYESLHARFAPSDALVDRWQARIPWTDVLLRNFEQAAQENYITQDLPFTLQDGTGVEHWVANFHGVVDEGRLVRIWGVARNETDLIAANESLVREQTRLKETAQTLQDLVDASPLPVVIIDRSLRVRLWSVAAEALFGWQAAEVLGEVLPIVPAQERPSLQPGREDRQYGVPRHRLRKDGSSIVVNLWTTPFRDASGNVVGQLAILADVTEQKRLEHQAIQAQKLEALGTLAAGIAHDFNNILFLLRGHASLAREALDPSSQALPDISAIENAADRGASLVRQILLFSRPQEQPRTPLSVSAVVEEGLSLLRATLPKGLQVLAEFPAALPQVAGDPAQIQQVLVNLGINAAQAMPDQQGTLQVSLRRVYLDRDEAANVPGLREGHYVRLTFGDNGCGMNPATVDRIFDPFFTTKAAGRGSGLGLSIVRGIMLSHHGAITVSSELGKGTTFQLYFPALDTATTLTPISRRSTDLIGQGQTILYLDDEPQLVELARRFIERAGYRVRPYTDHAAAMAAFEADPQGFDLVITDLSMPGTDGIAITQRILAIRPDIPVIICTGYADARDEARALECGARAVISKPAAAEEICRTLSCYFSSVA